MNNTTTLQFILSDATATIADMSISLGVNGPVLKPLQPATGLFFILVLLRRI